jgi:hypothetical protein
MEVQMDKKNETPNAEIVSLSSDLSLFDAGDLTLEALEQRLEMAVAVLPQDFSCGSFDCGGFSCGNFKVPAPAPVAS